MGVEHQPDHDSKQLEQCELVSFHFWRKSQLLCLFTSSGPQKMQESLAQNLMILWFFSLSGLNVFGEKVVYPPPEN